MMKATVWTCMIGVLMGLMVGTSAARAGEDYLSPLALVPDKDGRHVWVAQYTARQVVAFDVGAAKVARTVPLPGRPSGLAISPDGSFLYVTVAEPAGRVCAVDVEAGKVTWEVPVGHTPTGAVVHPDGKTLYVCNRFTNDVSVVELPSRKHVAKIRVVREPVAAAMTPDGKWLLVANHLPVGPSDGDEVAAVVSIIEVAAKTKVADIRLPNGSTGLRGICVSPDGRHAYVTHVLARYQLPTTQLERGWMNTNALSLIDTAARSLINTVLLDDVDYGAANPWGVICTPDGKAICVTHAGTHEVSVIDRAGLHAKLDRLAKGEPVVGGASSTPADVPNDLAFLVDLRRRLKLAGNGPRGLAVIGTKVYAAEYFTDSLGVVDIDPQVRPGARSLPLGPGRPVTVVRQGEMFFNDAALCFQQWQSCASCHPDGRADGLNWDLLNDGMGNPKNTKSMLLSHKTPPAMMSGVRDTAEAAVRAGIRNIQFAVRPEEDAAAIDEYLKTLEPVPSPYLIDGRLSPSAQRGEGIFLKAGCATCHPSPLYTNLKKYDVGTGRDTEKGRPFDTPTLVEVWRTAPYLYDGRSVTIKDVLTRHNAGDKHGTTSGLTPEQIDDVAEYVLTR